MADDDRLKDDDVGRAMKRDDGKQHPEQRAVLGGGGEDGLPEPKSLADWAKRGAVAASLADERPETPGGSSQGHSDRKMA